MPTRFGVVHEPLRQHFGFGVHINLPDELTYIRRYAALVVVAGCIPACVRIRTSPFRPKYELVFVQC
jgi:hypothetical protein